MRSILKRLLIGFLSTVVVLFVLGVFGEVAKGDEVSLGSLFTAHAGEAFMGILSLTVYSSGLVILIPAVAIALIDYLVTRYFGRNDDF